jgi:hypothetical protein
MSMDLYIGPLIERRGGFGYDTFSRIDGLRSSFRYRCVEDARRDQRAIIVELGRLSHIRVHVCESLVEFEQSLAGDRETEGNSGAIPTRTPLVD